jgi:hypothetical protein
MSGPLKPICVKCQRFYHPQKNGVIFLEGMPRFEGAPAGREGAEFWQPYKLWRGDLWECRGCGHQIISGVARDPITEHYMPGFREVVEMLKPMMQVNDC